MQIKGLKKKIIFVVIIVYVVVGFATFLAFHFSSGRIIESLALRFATKEALLNKTRITSIIEREIAMARKMAEDNQLRKWVADEQNPLLRKQAFDELYSYRKFFRDKSYFIALKESSRYYVYTPKEKGLGGLEIATLDASKPADNWFYESMKDVSDYALNLNFDRTLQESKVWINVAMRNAQGEKSGFCGTGINITDFLNKIVYSTEPGVSVMLADSNGVIQAHKDRSIVEQNATANVTDTLKKITVFDQINNPDDRERLKQAISRLVAEKSEVEAFPLVLGNTHYLTAVTFMSHIGWLNIVMVDVSKVISIKAFFPLIAILLISLLLIVAMITLLINRMVLAPLFRLTNASRDIAAGKYTIQLPVTTQDEIGTLTDTFNTMTATMFDYTTNLEEKVKERTLELSEVNRQLEDSREKILKSIHYARIIQNSILPGQDLLAKNLGEHFVLYRPKELVGGDFYFLREFDGHALLACIDCTGHGIPGAFVTMTVSAVLNQVVELQSNPATREDPAAILSELNRQLQENMKQCQVDSGLDISICHINRESKTLIFAGAVLSLYIVSDGKVREIKGNSKRIGYRNATSNYRYDNHRIKLMTGDACYLTTDGVLDLPTGQKGYGLGSQKFKEILAEYGGISMNQQLMLFEQELEGLRGSNPPRDDITLVGFRI